MKIIRYFGKNHSLKKYILILPYLFLFMGYGQKTYTLNEVDNPPLLKSCKDTNSPKECFTEELQKYIHQEIDIRNLIPEGNGVAYAQFVITTDAKVDSIRIRSRKKALKKESERLIKSLKFKSPASLNGKAVNMVYVVPVNFQIKQFSSYDDFLASDISAKEFPDFEDASQPPSIASCKKDKSCIQDIFKKNLANRLLSMHFKPEVIKKTKFTFLLTKEGKIENTLIVSQNSEIQNAIQNYLDGIQIISPALNEKDEPITVRLTFVLEDV